MPFDDLGLHPKCDEPGRHPVCDKARAAHPSCDKLCPIARSDRVACVRR